MLKFLLLVVLMFLALGVAAVLMRRMMRISERIAELQTDMKKSQVQLDAQMKVLEEKRRASGATDYSGATDNLERNDVEEKNS